MPFGTMCVDLWSPGITEDLDSNKAHFLNSMCDLSQFIISSINNSTENGTQSRFLY